MLNINRLWTILQTNTECIYSTANGYKFKCHITGNNMSIERIEPDTSFFVKRKITKNMLSNAINYNPKCVADINGKIIGSSYCYAIIKYYSELNNQ